MGIDHGFFFVPNLDGYLVCSQYFSLFWRAVFRTHSCHWCDAPVSMSCDGPGSCVCIKSTKEAEKLVFCTV